MEVQDQSVRLPGLQIYSDDRYLMNQRSTSNSTLRDIDPEDIYSSSLSGLSNLSFSWKVLRDWRSTEFHDNSPTITNADEFETHRLSTLSVKHDYTISFTYLLDRIFAVLKEPYCDQFVDEFKYSIVCSNILNEIHQYKHTLKIKKSIGDFNLTSAGSSYANLDIKYMATTIGLLKIVKADKVHVLRTMNHNKIVLICWKLFHKLNRVQLQHKCKTSRIVATILLVLYLSSLQKRFRTQFIKFRTMEHLKFLLSNLQIFDKTFFKFYLKYKELKSGNEADVRIPIIHDLLQSALDVMFFKLRNSIRSLLPLTDEETLIHYCDMYHVNTTDISYYIGEEQTTLDDKSFRTSLFKRFFLCCLLAIPSKMMNMNCTCRKGDVSVFNFLFTEPHYQAPKYANPIQLIKAINEVNEIISTTLKSLEDYNYVLNRNDILTNECIIEKAVTTSDVGTNMIIKTCKVLRGQLLTLDNSIGKSDRSVVISELEDLLHTYHYKEAHQYKTPTNFNPDKRTISHQSHGFSLDILRTPTHPTEESCLNKEINFINVNEVEQDLISDNEFEPEKNSVPNLDERCELSGLDDPVHYQSFKKLSDKELGDKLNQKILNFAKQNKKGREKLRAQKSFGLLKRKSSRKQSDDMLVKQGKTEESIPIIYEFKELIHG